MMKSCNYLSTGTISETFFSISPNLRSVDVMKKLLLATVGASVSFIRSILLKNLIKKNKKQVKSERVMLWIRQNESPMRTVWAFLF